MPEWLSYSLNLAAVGISIVFGALAIITLAVSLIRRADDRWIRHEEAQHAAAVDKDQNIDTTTLVLICAAVATMARGRYHIRRVRRLMPSTAVHGTWSLQGRAVLHGSHVVSKKR
ncbi:MAG: hypothetical protein KKA42_06925 [candidate division Zixibacteria bacterium]|nr:hypothetical protein [candidate division Zixibacteria bacterium]